jgi:nucleoside-diphosphate-sugar epimerase
VNDHRNRVDDEPGRPPARVRSRRTAAKPAQADGAAEEAAASQPPGRALVVAVTGAATGVGRALAAALLAHPDVRTVIGVDATRGDLADVTWRVMDVREPALVQRLSRCDVVVHAVLPDVPGREAEPAPGDREVAQARLVDGARTVLTAAAAAGVGRAVLISSAMVYGASRDNPVPLDEDADVRASADGSALDGLLEIEELAARSSTVHPGLAVTVLRPAVLAGPGVDSVFSRHFVAPRLLVVKDSRPHWQFCHVDDLVSALVLAVLGEVSGAVTVGCEGFLSQSEVESIAGLRRIELPARIAYGTAERLHRLGMTPAPASELAYTAEPWVVPSTRLRAAGWRPAYDNAAALRALLDENGLRDAGPGRHFGRDATLGAAGATVAVLGTAAVVRQIRRQRRG